MRLYSFVNVYLSQLQKGLQTAHLVSEIAVNAQKTQDNVLASFNSWAEEHKTIIILDAGNHFSVLDTFDELVELNNRTYPIGLFREDAESLNCAATACGIILPEDVYGLAASFRNRPDIMSGIEMSLFFEDKVLYADKDLYQDRVFEVSVTKQIFDLAVFINSFRLSSS